MNKKRKSQKRGAHKPLVYSILPVLIVVLILLFSFAPSQVSYTLFKIIISGTLMMLPNFLDMLVSYLTVNNGIAALQLGLFHFVGFFASVILLTLLIKKGE